MVKHNWAGLVLGIMVCASGCESATHTEASSAVSDAHVIAHASNDPEIRARAADAFVGAEDPAATLAGIDLAIQITNHNLARAETTGFRSTRVISVAGQPPKFSLNMEQGALEQTRRELDIGISGAGFFGVRIPTRGAGSLVYTRNGHFFINPNGDLVTSDGYHIDPPLRFPAGARDITIAEDGSVVCKPSDTSKQCFVGTLKLYLFANPSELYRDDKELLHETHSSGVATEGTPNDGKRGTLMQEFLEASNVNPYRERQRLGTLRTLRGSLLRSIDGNLGTRE